MSSIPTAPPGQRIIPPGQPGVQHPGPYQTGQQIPPNMIQQMPNQGGAPIQVQQVPVAQAQQAPQPAQPNVDMDQKRLQDMIEALNLINNLKDDINNILDNVGKSNAANSSIYSSIISNARNASSSRNEASSDQGQNKHSAGGLSAQLSSSAAISTPASVNSQQANLNSQQQQQGGNNDSDQLATDSNDAFLNLDLEQQQFFEKSDNKFLQDRVQDINKSIIELDKIVRELQPVQIINIPDFNSILLDQGDERYLGGSGTKLINNYRWCAKLQESLNSTILPTYKRFGQSYAEKKSSKYRTYPIKIIKKEELEKSASAFLGHNEIKVVSAQKTEHQFVLDILMPQSFKFVLLLFDMNIEKFQVRQLDSRILKLYFNNNNNKASDEICNFDFDQKNLSNVFQRLEENCLYAILHFKTEQNPNHFRMTLQWLKHFINLFNAKCVKCEKHLLNGVPPTWRDLKTYEPYHDECMNL